MHTENFFDHLQAHSAVKLKLLHDYIVPWIRKILLNGYLGHKCLIIDGFAGKGYYSNCENNEVPGSPMILLDDAVNFYNQNTKKPLISSFDIYLLFIEKNTDNFVQLKENISKKYHFINQPNDGNLFNTLPNYPAIHLAVINDDFKTSLKRLLPKRAGVTLIPTFCFADPFGFSQVSFDLICQLLKNQSSEILFNLIYEETNRFINHKNPKINIEIANLFGIKDIKELQDKVNRETDPVARKNVVINVFSGQLHNKAKVQYVLNFEIMARNKTKLVLFYGTNNKHGLSAMKDAMWNNKNTGINIYDDSIPQNQLEFEFLAEYDTEQITSKVGERVKHYFSGQTVDENDVDDYILTKTVYPSSKFCKKALKYLFKKSMLSNVRKKNGKRWRKGTFSDVWISFP